MLTDSATKTAGRIFAMLQCVLQPGLYQTRTEEHKVHMYENLVGAKLDEDVKISVVIRETPMKLRDHVQDKPQQFETNFKLRAVSTCLNTHRKWIADDLNEPDSGASPIAVDHTQTSNRPQGKLKGKRHGQMGKTREKIRAKEKKSAKARGEGQDAKKPDKQDKECRACGKTMPFRMRRSVKEKEPPRHVLERSGQRESRNCE